MNTDYDSLYGVWRDNVENELSALGFGESVEGIPRLLAESMRYSLLAGGKRLRAVLVLAAAELFSEGKVEAESMPYACAVELIHAYSLIHDDMPCIDNDDVRRGRKTNHIVYGEGQALLAGDGLLTYAFEHMLNAACRSSFPERSILAMKAIADGAGVSGMVAGQCIDVLYEKNAELPEKERVLHYIHEKKTAALITAALLAGAHIAGADEAGIAAIAEYGRRLGISFQITDDILDIEGDEKLLGKPVNSDIKNGKLTYPGLYGIEKARHDALAHQAAAVEAVSSLGKGAGFLIELAKRQVVRVV